MKKLISLTLALMLVLSLAVPAFAAGDTTTGNKDSNKTPAGEATLSTSTAVSYTVTIPADCTIQWSATSTDFGTVSLNADSRLDPSGTVTVAWTNGAFANKNDATATLAYTIEDSEGVKNQCVLSDTTRTSPEYDVKIADTVWTAARAGEYEGSVTFTITYAANYTA